MDLELRTRRFCKSAEEILIDKAQLMQLTGPEMTVLIGGMRVLKQILMDLKWSVYEKSGKLTNDFFINLLDMNIKWKVSSKEYI